MATVSGEVAIRATPAQILDVLADLPGYPQWSAVHKRATVDERHPDGRPRRATMAVSAVGLTDEQVLDYTWSARGVAWSLVRSGQQRAQRGRYTITPAGPGVSRVRYDLDITPLLPLPGPIVRRVMHRALSSATEGLRARVEARHDPVGPDVR